MFTNKNNVEYHAGKKAFRDGLKQIDNPYLSTTATRNDPDSRWTRWDVGYRDECDSFMFGN